MLFASDLDQTLIYSEKSFRLQEEAEVPPVTLIETLDGRPISYMLDKTLTKLRQLATELPFVPVTTRTIEQYQRIVLFQQDIAPKYAVVSNGGNILKDGIVDGEWNKQIRVKAEGLCLCANEVIARFNELKHQSWVTSERQADSLFYYFIIERSCLPLAEVAAFGQWAGEQNWNMSVQGRKLYLVPKVVNKWDAIAYVRDELGEKTVAAAGDSLLDLCILNQADYAFSPCHGEIWDTYKAGRLECKPPKFTKRSGIFASEDIIDYVSEKGQALL